MLGVEKKIRNIKLINKIFKILKINNPLKNYLTHVKDRPGHDKNYSLDSSKAKRILKNYKINSFDKNLLQTIKWYYDNQKWLKFTKKNYKGQRLGVVKW